MNLQLNEYAIPGNKYIDIGWAEYWVLYRVQTEMVSKPIHLFLKLKSFFSVRQGQPAPIRTSRQVGEIYISRGWHGCAHC